MSYSSLLPRKRVLTTKIKETVVNIFNNDSDLKDKTVISSTSTEVFDLLRGYKELITIKHWA